MATTSGFQQVRKIFQITVFENQEKSLILQHCERSELRLLSIEPKFSQNQEVQKSRNILLGGSRVQL